MVLRKHPPPPPLDNSSKWYNRFEPRSQTSPTAKSASPTSPKRLTRPRRAQTSPFPHRIPSADSIYSPDLNTSPAFDLMPLEQAQRSPIGSSGEPPNPWADELVEPPNQGGQGYHSRGGSLGAAPNSSQGPTSVNNKLDHPLPPLPTDQGPAANDWQSNAEVNDSAGWEHLEQPSVQLQSNNPFLKAQNTGQNPWGNGQFQDSLGVSGHGSRSPSFLREDASDGMSQGDGYIPMTARLSLLDQPTSESESPWAEERSSSVPQNPQLDGHQQFANPEAYHTSQVSTPDQAPMGIYPGNKKLPPGTGIITPSITTSSASTQSSHELIDFDDPPRSGAEQKGPSESAPALPQRGNVASSTLAAGPELHPPQGTPSDSVSGVDANRINDERSETYVIRHINWTDNSGKLRKSPVLVQNKNGPCPLLALVNALVLRAGEDTQPPIVKALRTREHISLGLLIEAMFDELITHLGPDDEFPDIEALSQFLTMLHTGMNVNPRLTLESEDAVGTFLRTSDISFYSTFGIPLVHGWVAAPSTETHSAFTRVAQYHEDIQLLHFRKEELENQVLRGGSLSPDEEQTMHDIQLIQRFVDVENATQLSTFGLSHLVEKLVPGSMSILFRNDHFSTLYKHPQSHKLFTLVTDAGYSSHAEVVWESLVDVNGSNAEFSAGDFRPVSHAPHEASDPSGPRSQSNRQSHSTAANEQHNTTLSPQEQADADYAYALSLQFQEEEQRENDGNNRPRNRPASTPHYPTGQSYPAHNRSASAINTGDRQRSSTGRRPSGHDEGLPSYEQSASSPMVPTPQRSQGAIDPSRDNRYSRNQYGRRPVASSMSAALPERPKERNKDCVVM